MKKLIVGLTAPFLMSVGLVAASSGMPAQAACQNPGPYTGTVDTTSGLTVRPFGDGPKVRTFTASVASDDTNAIPRGNFVFRFKRVGGGAQFATRAVPADGSATLKRKFNNPGVWNVTVRFVSPDCSVFQGSKSGNRQFRVARG